MDAERPESVPTPALVTFTVCATGLEPPAVALKLMVVGLRPMAGDPGDAIVTRSVSALLRIVATTRARPPGEPVSARTCRVDDTVTRPALRFVSAMGTPATGVPLESTLSRSAT